MDVSTAGRILDFLKFRISAEESVDIGFFGGEPLLYMPLIREIVHIVKKHPISLNREVNFQIVTNGTLITEEVLETVIEERISLGISCDGLPEIQDKNRKYRNGKGSSMEVEQGIKLAVNTLPWVMVNAVFNPDTFEMLPDTIEYFYAMGIRNIYANANYSASWSKDHLPLLEKTYSKIAELYQKYHINDDPSYINCIDSKLILILKDGYAPNERCSMGRGEFAFGPEGEIYPCERLAGDCSSEQHRIGHIDTGVDLTCINVIDNKDDNAGLLCASCSLESYCMHWCGCSNYFSSNSYAAPGAFICALEKISIQSAFTVFEQLSAELGEKFLSNINKK